MPMAAVPVPMPALPPMQAPATAAAVVNDSLAKDAIIAWFRGEFAAANAMIDALCGHLAQLGGGYDGVFEAVHQRRMNWIPVLQMQKYHSIADVTVELGRVVAAGAGGGGGGEVDKRLYEENGEEGKEVVTEVAAAAAETEVVAAEAEDEEDDSPNSDITDSG